MSYCTQKVSIPPEEIKSSPIAKPGTPNPNPQSVYVNVETDTPLTPAENSMRTFLQNCQLLSTIEDRKAQNFFRVNLQKSVDENPTIDPNTKNQMTSLISNCVKPWYEKNAFFIFSGVGIVILGAYGIHSIAVSIQENLDKGKAVLDNINKTVADAQDIVEKTDGILVKADVAVQNANVATQNAVDITDWIKDLRFIPQNLISGITDFGSNNWKKLTASLSKSQQTTIEPLQESFQEGVKKHDLAVDSLMLKGQKALSASIETIQTNLSPLLSELTLEKGWARDKGKAKKVLRGITNRTKVIFGPIRSGENLFTPSPKFIINFLNLTPEARIALIKVYRDDPKKMNFALFLYSFIETFVEKKIK